MSKQWEPVTQLTITDENGMMVNVERANYLELVHDSNELVAILPDELRLCRAVSASVQPVPVPDDVRETILSAIDANVELIKIALLTRPDGNMPTGTAKIANLLNARAWLETRDEANKGVEDKERRGDV